ncbi:MAG: hypothetical protein ACLFQX_11415, partial [Candidatus Kapaibacterium sp.]
MDKQKEIIHEVQDYLMNEYGHYFESLGAKGLLGRIFGLLAAHPGPMSLKSLAVALHVSKPAVSTTVKYGLDSGIIKKVYIKEYPRENFFEIRSDLTQTMIEPGFRKLSIMNEKLGNALDMIRRRGAEGESVDEIRDRIESIKFSF